ncbi:TPA: invasion protein, partial [Campylobacter lari]|nr:invasion protein [Campylobacter lari]
LNSDDFKQYENKTYPPLVNPKNIDIEPSDYCAELAWKLNIPLENAKFIYISPHGVGAAAFLTLLNEACNVYCSASWVSPNNGYYRYNLNFKSLLQYSQTAINISETNILDLDKYLNLISCDIPILIQTRDPISLLKHSYGRDWSKVQRNYNQNFNLNFNYQEYINFLKPNKTYMK